MRKEVMVGKIKVLLVDDSLFMRKMLAELLSSFSELDVVGSAMNGKDALDKIGRLHPQVVLLDINMPIMDGIECLKLSGEQYPEVSFLIHSNLAPADADITIKALRAGAIDFIAKPNYVDLDTLSTKQEEYLQKIRIAVNSKKRKKTVSEHAPILQKQPGKPTGKQHPVGKNSVEPAGKDKQQATGKDSVEPAGNDGVEPMTIRYIAIGVSTGGPQALHRLMPELNANLPASLLIVQHMPVGYTDTLAQSLNRLSSIRVKEAEDGEIVMKQCAYIAPGGYHMGVKNAKQGGLTIALSKEEPQNGLRPSFNVLLNSLCKAEVKDLAVLVLTGMGNDGTMGIREIKRRLESVFVIAQDEDSSIVHGMPGSAIRAGVVDLVLPLQELASKINQIAAEGEL